MFRPPPARSFSRWVSAPADATTRGPRGTPRRARRLLRPAPPLPSALLDAIAAGEVDAHLSALADAVGARMHLLHTVEQATALAQLCVGAEVRINHTVKPRYLHGARGRVITIDGHEVTVCLQRPIGRFTSGQIRCSALALERLSPAPTTHVA